MKKVTYTILKQIFAQINQFSNIQETNDLKLVYENNQPVLISGGMAMVAKVIGSNGQNMALKVWLQKPNSDIIQRYKTMEKRRILDAHLLYGKYLERAFKIGNCYLDAHITPWLTNYIPLNEYVEFHKRDPNLMTKLANDCESLFQSMKHHGVVHGDLHPENIVIGPGMNIKILDLDSLSYAENLPCDTSIRGLPTFQHPERNHMIYSNTDDISMLSILTSLFGVASQRKYFLDYEYCDDLGIRQSDILQPEKSPILCELSTKLDKSGMCASLLISSLLDPYKRKKSLFVKTKNELLQEEIRGFFKRKSDELEFKSSSKLIQTRLKIKTYFDKRGMIP